DPRLLVGPHLDAPAREVRRELAAGHRLVDELRGDRPQEIVLAVEEGEPFGLALLDDVDLDAPHARQALALEVLLDPAVALVLAARGFGRLPAKIRVGLVDAARR